MSNQIQNLLQTEMDRKQFLKHVGASALAISGIAGLIKSLTNPHSRLNNGYGVSSYGGVKNK